MKRTVFAVVLAVFVLTGALSSGTASAAGVDEQLKGVSITLPERWSVRKIKSGLTWATASLRDSEKIANIWFKVREPHSLYDSIHEWITKNEIPKNLKNYAGGGKYDYQIQKKETRKITLGSGETADIIDYTIIINGHWRYVMFAYFSCDSGAEQWCMVYLYNQGKTADQSDSLRTIMKGISVLSSSTLEPDVVKALTDTSWTARWEGRRAGSTAVKFVPDGKGIAAAFGAGHRSPVIGKGSRLSFTNVRGHTWSLTYKGKGSPMTGVVRGKALRGFQFTVDLTLTRRETP